VLGKIEYSKGGFENTPKITKEFSVTLLHDSAIEDCIVSEISKDIPRRQLEYGILSNTAT
jgi:hypothetical protein